MQRQHETENNIKYYFYLLEFVHICVCVCVQVFKIDNNIKLCAYSLHFTITFTIFPQNKRKFT